MNNLDMQHLTDEQFAESLGAEELSPQIEAHLAQCDACRAEMAVFLESLDRFADVAMDWSKAQAAFGTLSLELRTSPPVKSSWFAPLGLATAALLTIAIVTSIMHRQPAAADQTIAAVAASDDSPSQIAEDNHLLQSVNLELGNNDPSPYQEYRLESSGSTRSEYRPEVRRQ